MAQVNEFDLNQGTAAKPAIMLHDVTTWLLTSCFFSVYACDALNGTT
jgi:hypothetical protein